LVWLWCVLSGPAAYAQQPEVYRIPTHAFAGTPLGPFRTGTFEEMWVDEQRDEPATKDTQDKRHLMVQIWYPADVQGEPQTAAYALHRELYPHDELESWLDAVKHVRTSSVERAPLSAARGAKLPVLIYNPGGIHPHFSATFQTEFLASHGYVVVAIGHTGTNRIERFPDGYVYTPEPEHDRLARRKQTQQSEMESFLTELAHISKHQMPLEVADIRFVLDRLQAQQDKSGSFFFQRLDLTRVGALGWSLGGALSLQASRDEPRIKAAANLDGWLYTDVVDTGTKRPILLMHSDGSADPELKPETRELIATAEARLWQLLKNSTGDWYDLRLARSNHGHFSDRTLFEAAEPAALHPRLAHDIINNLTLEFFDKYVRGRKDTPLLSGQSYPEVQMTKKTSGNKPK
jgi:predicted dienelactone hydrolase